MNSHHLPPIARKWIVNAGLAGMVMLAILAARDLWTGRTSTAGRLDLPQRLSCSLTGVPSVWEDGQLHFDFKNRVMLTNGGRKRVYSGDRVWSDGQDRLISIVGFLNVPDGSQVRMADIIRVHPLSLSRNGVWSVSVSGKMRGNAESTRLSCLGMA
jgi:hypothetical protein